MSERRGVEIYTPLPGTTWANPDDIEPYTFRDVPDDVTWYFSILYYVPYSDIRQDEHFLLLCIEQARTKRKEFEYRQRRWGGHVEYVEILVCRLDDKRSYDDALGMIISLDEFFDMDISSEELIQRHRTHPDPITINVARERLDHTMVMEHHAGTFDHLAENDGNDGNN